MKVRFKSLYFYISLNLGVYTWANGDRALVSNTDGKLTFGRRVVYPDNDFRLEYRGDVKEGHVPDGEGRLTIKGNIAYSGQWNDGISAEN